jgi:hypothetical protein
MKRFILLLFVFLAGVVQASENQAGFVAISSDGAGYVYFPKSLPSTKSIFIQWPDARGKIRCCRKLNGIEKTDAKSAAEAQSIMISNLRNDSDPGFVAYKIRSKLPHAEVTFTGIALAANKVIARSPYRILARTNGKELSANICFGTEGKNLIAKESSAYQLLYMHFDYEIDEQPKCNAQERRILESATPDVQ